MKNDVCVLACGVRQVTNDKKKADQSAEKVPDQGKILNSLKSNRSWSHLLLFLIWLLLAFVATYQVRAKWWVEPTLQRERGHGLCPCTGGAVMHVEPLLLVEIGCWLLHTASMGETVSDSKIMLSKDLETTGMFPYVLSTRSRHTFVPQEEHPPGVMAGGCWPALSKRPKLCRRADPTSRSHRHQQAVQQTN